MGQKKHLHHVNLTKEERSKLERMTTVGKIGVRKLKRCQILLLADESHEQGQKTDQAIAEKLDTSLATVSRTRVRYAKAGLKGALNEKARSGRPPGVSGEERAKVTALACSTPPDGFSHWSLRLLADKAVELELVEQISHTTVGDILKKTLSNRT
jgi:transposase